MIILKKTCSLLNGKMVEKIKMNNENYLALMNTLNYVCKEDDLGG